MALSSTVQSMQELLAQIVVNLEKANRGNKAAAQRVRTGTVKLEKTAKIYRKESVAAEKASVGKRKKASKKDAGKKTAAKKPAQGKVQKASASTARKKAPVKQPEKKVAKKAAAVKQPKASEEKKGAKAKKVTAKSRAFSLKRRTTKRATAKMPRKHFGA